jgi:hypothetical protein
MKKWRSKLWMLIPILLIGGSSAVAWNLYQAQAATKPANVSCTGANAENFTCWQQHYGAIVANDSVEAAFADFRKEYEAVPYIKTNCHQIGHIIGRAGALRYQDLKETYAHGDNFCWSGYYHGAIETIAQDLGPEKILKQINQVCADFKQSEQYSFNHYNCVHGMGHGVMAVLGDNLFKALDACDLYDDTSSDWERRSCYGGVFMENVMNEINPGEHSEYFRQDDPLYPCTAVADKYLEQCYLMQTSHALKAVGTDYAKVFALCSAVKPPYDATCYQSLGRDISGNSSSDQAQTLARCQLGTTRAAQENCYTGAVKDYIAYFHDDDQGMALCNAIADAGLSASCREVAERYYQTF